MTRVGLVVSFDGTDFAGWQSQSGRGERTVQETLEAALAQVVAGGRIAVHGCGRTDSGAHALALVAHADLPSLPSRPRQRLNGLLAKDLRVKGVAVMPPGFHARTSARGKRYAYRFWLDRIACPLRRRVTHHVAWPMNLAAMRLAAAHFVGERDFASLQASGSSVTTSVRRITRCEVVGEAPDVRLVTEGTGFLRHMVRAMAGSLLEVGRGRRPPGWIAEALERRSREAAGPNAPARGLVLEEVSYEEPFAGLLSRAVGGEDPSGLELAKGGRE